MTDTSTEQPPKLPGVRYRNEKRVRHVAVTFNGQTKVVPQEYTVRVPVPPRNLDRVWLRVVIGGAVLFTAGAVAWSTSVIGGLLCEVTTPAIAYVAAASFEALWILCLIVEWLMRRQPDRAVIAKVIGWIGLVGVVAAVMTDGIHYDRLAAGIVGGFVSVVAKALWLVVFRIFRVQLSDLGAAVLQQSREDMAVTGVLIEEQQRLNETAAYYDAVFGPGAVHQALAFHAAEAPQLSAAQVAEAAQPSASSVPVRPPAPPSAPARPSSSAPDAEEDEEPQENEPGEQAAAVPIGAPTIASVVRTLTAADPGLRDVERREELIAEVARMLPEESRPTTDIERKRFSATVKRNLRTKVDAPRQRRRGTS